MMLGEGLSALYIVAMVLIPEHIISNLLYEL